MALRLSVFRMLLGASLAAFGPVLAQSPPDASTTPATSPAGTPSAPAPTQSPAPPNAPSATAPTAPTAPAASPAPTATPTAPSADTIKKARLAGYRPETRKGVAMFCRESAEIGTRLATKKCVDEDQLKSLLDVNTQLQDTLRKPSTCVGMGC